MEEAVQWLKGAPFDGGEEVEIRPLFETSDLGESLLPSVLVKRYTSCINQST
jgi:hypothetical protein